jgi:hypothetical protein
VSHGLLDLMGEAGRIRAECDHFLRLVGDLESLATNVHHLHEAEHGEISSANYVYGRSVQENLQRAAADVENWRSRVQDLITASRVRG